MIKGMVGGNEKDITRIPMLDAQTQTYKDGWEVRDNNDNIVWGANRTLESDKSSINFKGYGLNLKDYKISGNMTQKGVETTINGVSPLNFTTDKDVIDYSISGNMTQSGVETTINGTSTLSFTTNRDVIDYSISGNMTQSGVETTINGDGTLTYTTNSDLIDYSITGNMGQYKNSTVSGTSPLNFSTIIGGISDYSISGNMTYSGTPSTSSPIYPSETGDRTGNLFDKSNADIYGNSTLSSQNQWDYNPEYTGKVLRIPCKSSTQYTISFNRSFDNANLYRIAVTNSDSVPISGEIGTIFCSTFYTGYEPITRTITTGSAAKYILLQINAGLINDMCDALMINTGSTALPYEPYGYKIPITCGGSTQNFYITSPLCKMGDYTDISSFTSNNITRKIKRLVLTGDESFDIVESKYYRMTLPAEISDRNNFFCSHFFVGSYSDGISLGQARGGGKPSYNFFFNYDNGSGGTTAFKNFLTTQYSAGTPVTVWYILESPETESATIPTITTVSGANTLSIGTTLAPTNISVTYAGTATPTYTTPIYPYETGDRTKNIYNTAETVWIENTLDDDGNPTGSTTSHYTGNFTPVKPNTTYYISKIAESTTSGHRIYYYDSSKHWIGRSNALAYNDYLFTVPSGCYFIQIQIGSTLVNTDAWMIAEGQIAVAFEPYGYTLPVSHTGTGGNIITDPIYLSEPIRKIGGYTDKVGLSIGGANRNIKKLVLTGYENWSRDINSGTYYTDSCTDYLCTTGVTCMCSHYVGVENAIGATSALEGMSFITNPDYYRLYVKDPNFNSLEAFVAFLKGQNTNGTPVTVWYVRATPETETISMPTISNVNGENSLYIGTKLQPADISLTYSNTGNPTPTVPIYPYEVGNRTENVMPSANAETKTDNGIKVECDGKGIYHISGTASADASISFSIPSFTIPVSVSSGGHGTMALFNGKIGSAQGDSYIEFHNNGEKVDGWQLIQANRTSNSYAVMNGKIVDSICFTIKSGITANADVQPMFTDDGVIPFSYEPYGYKLPYSVNSISQTPIYLSEPIRRIGDYVDVTEFYIGGINRKIKKIVLTGDEDGWRLTATRKMAYLLSSESDRSIRCVCSHYTGTNAQNISQLNDLECSTSVNTGELAIYDSNFTALDAFKTYLSQQYAAGTPVTVWYVLETQETETITMPTITTVSGVNTLSIDTSYSPFNVSLTYSNTGDPTPTVPIYPYEVSDRTDNLVRNVMLSNNIAQYAQVLLFDADLLPDTSYTLSFNSVAGNSLYTNEFIFDETYFKTKDGMTSIRIKTRSNLDKTDARQYVDGRWVILKNSVTQSQSLVATDIMFYIGYKIPITCGGNTYPIYLREPIRKIGNYVDVAEMSIGGVNRWIKKYIVNGTENWLASPSERADNYYIDTAFSNAKTLMLLVCSHYESVQTSYSGITSAWISNTGKLNITDRSIHSLTDFTNWLKSQYSAGTPVTVWYILESPETESTTIPTITTVSGNNTLSIGTALQPSDISLTYSNTGNPTPTVPIYPYECGDRTINLYNDRATVDLPVGIRYGMAMPAGRTYSIYNNTNNIVYNYESDGYGRHEACSPHSTATVTLQQVGSTTSGFFMGYNDASLGGVTIVSGSTPPDHYIPYGFQIPITCGGSTQNIYLQNPIRKMENYVDIAGMSLNGADRQIKKLVLTGEENIYVVHESSTAGVYCCSMRYSECGATDIMNYNKLMANINYPYFVCSHLKMKKAPSVQDWWYDISSGEIGANSYSPNPDVKYYNLYFIFCIPGCTTLLDFKNYFAAQYAAGTPVTIWYVLATKQTETTTMPTIQTTTGDNTFSITTSLQPSDIEITGHIKSHTVMTYIDYTDMTKSYTIGDINKVNAFTQRRRCNMLDDGTITAFYGDPTFIEDGSNGQVMVYQPKFYYKVEPVLLDGIKIRKCKYYISDYQLPGYKIHPAFIDRTDPNNLKEFPFVCIGAYEGCLQNGDTYITDDSASSTSYKLSSIAFTSTATNGVKPSSGVISPFGTIGNYETTASNRGTGWHIENIWIASMNQLMFVIEMCNPNSQTALGSGVTGIPDTPNTANNSSLVGSTSSLGNGSGRATTTYSNYNGTTAAQTAADRTSVSYRGMENPFGNIWKWVDGMTIKNTSATEHVPYICKSFAYTRNSTLTNYDMVNVTIPSNGYVTAFGYDPNFDWLFISAETNSSNTGAIRDYLYTTNSGYTCALLGGFWNDGARVGLFYWILSTGSSTRYRFISARICYLPQ